MSRKPVSAMRRLLTQPHRFAFDAAVQVLMQARRTADPADAAQFHSQAGRSHPAGEVLAVVPAQGGGKPRVTVALIGLHRLVHFEPASCAAKRRSAVLTGGNTLHNVRLKRRTKLALSGNDVQVMCPPRAGGSTDRLRWPSPV